MISDPLPAGTDVTWSIKSVAGAEATLCAITGAQGSQVLTCSVSEGADFIVHIVSGTTAASCGQYNNTATLTTGNVPGAEASATTSVLCPALALRKVADAATVDAGKQIGFTVVASNAAGEGTGSAHAATLQDPLPAGTGVNWSIDAAATTATGCAITDVAGKQVLNCALGDLAAGAEVRVHVTSATTTDSCAVYPNTARLGAANAPSVSAEAKTTVQTCLGVEAQPQVHVPLAATGASHLSGAVKWGLALLLLGGLMLLATRRRDANRSR